MSKERTITPNEPADFTPALGNYKSLQPFRYWCQKVLPLVYDDSLSYYELLCKVVDYLNKTMEDVETLHGDVANLHTAYEQLQEYVNNYFDTLDVQEEINNKLDEMVNNGTLSSLLNLLAGTYYNVMLSGVKNDGSEDCGAIINELLKTNKALFFPSGRYLVTTPIELDTGVSILGVTDAYTSTFSNEKIGTYFIVRNNDCFTASKEGGFLLNNFTIRSENGDKVGKGISAYSSTITPFTTHPIINNVFFTYLDIAINFNENCLFLNDTEIINCKIDNCNTGILNGAWGMTLFNTRISNCVIGASLNKTGFISSKHWKCETGLEIKNGQNWIINYECDNCNVGLDFQGNLCEISVIGIDNNLNVKLSGYKNTCNIYSNSKIDTQVLYLHGIETYFNTISCRALNNDSAKKFTDLRLKKYVDMEYNAPNTITYNNSIIKCGNKIPYYRAETQKNLTFDGTNISGTFIPLDVPFKDMEVSKYATLNNILTLAFKSDTVYNNFVASVSIKNKTGIYTEYLVYGLLVNNNDSPSYPTIRTPFNIIPCDGYETLYFNGTGNTPEITFFVIQNALVEQNFSANIDITVYGY